MAFHCNSVIYLILCFIITGPGGENKTTEQIFSSNAAFGILTNDLVTILENEKVILTLIAYIANGKIK